MNWVAVAIVMAFFYLGAFIYCISRRSWTRAGLFVGVANIFLAFLVSVAPVRGWADPEYVGFTFGLLYAPPGPLVTLVAGTILALATFSACAAVLNRHGTAMRVVAIFDGLMALNVGGALLLTLVNTPDALKIQLGEYLTIGPLGAAIIMAAMLFLPLTTCAVWAWRRSGTMQGSVPVVI